MERLVKQFTMADYIKNKIDEVVKSLSTCHCEEQSDEAIS